MKIEDLLSPDLMIMDLKATTQEEAIKEMADLEVKQGVVNNEEEFIKSIWAREKNQQLVLVKESPCHTQETSTLIVPLFYLQKVLKELIIKLLMDNQFIYSL